MNESFEMIAKTLYGLEEVLAEELTALGADKVQIGRRMVAFEGDKAMMYKANFHCRTALKILKPIAKFEAEGPDAIYENIKKIPWEKYLHEGKRTFAVDSVVYSEIFTHSKFVAYRTKDGIVDYFTEKGMDRPSIRIKNPDIRLHIHISHKECTVALDSSGESLYKRGYRKAQTEAPINEVLAAGMILKTGWRGDCNFVDPMCGSGTLLIEAALIALNIAPGIYRDSYAFEKWEDFDRALFEEISRDDSAEKEFGYKIYGSDISVEAVQCALTNVKSAGLSKYIQLKVLPLQEYDKAPEKGILVTNPPYGERLNEKNLFQLYQILGERLKHVFIGYDAWLISSNKECIKQIGLRPSSKIKLINGELECEFLKFSIFSGKQKDYKAKINLSRKEKNDFKH